MKSLITALLCLTSFAISAQKIERSKIPGAVKEGFNRNFPKVKDGKWLKENGDYEVAFRQGKAHMTAVFAADGSLKETEKAIALSQLPAGATKYVKEHYKGSKIKEAAVLKMADGSTNYEVEVKSIDVIFDSQGNFLKTRKG